MPGVEIGLERLAAEIGGELRIGGVVVQRGRKLRGIEVLTAAADGGDADPGFIQDFLEHFRRLREILLDVFRERLQSVEAKPRSHLDAHLRVRLHRSEHVAAHRKSELIARQREDLRRGRDRAQGGEHEFATVQHWHTPQKMLMPRRKDSAPLRLCDEIADLIRHLALGERAAFICQRDVGAVGHHHSRLDQLLDVVDAH